MVERYLAKVNVAGSSLVSRSKTKHTPLRVCFCFAYTESKRDLRVELRAGASILPDRDIFPHHFTAKQTAQCAVWRGAPLKAQVSFPAPKQSTPPCGCAFVLRNRIQTRLEGGSCERERAFCPTEIFSRTTSRQNKQHGVLFGGARRPFPWLPCAKGAVSDS